jgi:hypothetical protein
MMSENDIEEFGTCIQFKNENYCTNQEAPLVEIPTDDGSQLLLPVLLAAVALGCLSLFLIQVRLFRKLQSRHSALLLKSAKKTDEDNLRPPLPPTSTSTSTSTNPDFPFSLNEHAEEFKFKFESQTFRTSKSDELIDNCEDWANVDTESQIFVIADGVSQSFFPSKWAQLLVTNAHKARDLPSYLKIVGDLTEDWEIACELLLANQDQHSFIRQKQKQGAQSTFANLQLITRGTEQYWHFSTIGDSLLAILDTFGDERRIHRTLPWNNMNSFPGSPDTVSSVYPYLRGQVKSFEFPATENQELLLMTDALARHLLLNCKTESLIEDFFTFLNKSDVDFQNWIDTQRDNGLQDDDSTLIHVFPSP